jgi:hypothetical protein
MLHAAKREQCDKQDAGGRARKVVTLIHAWYSMDGKANAAHSDAG